MARIDDNQGLIGIDRSVWLDARGEDVPGPLVGPVQRAWVHGPVRRPVEPFRPVLPVANAGLGQRALCANIVETPSYPLISEQGGKDDSLCW